MADILVMKTTGKTAPKVDKGKPDPTKLIKGKYETKTWNHFTGEDDRLYCGIWESTPARCRWTTRSGSSVTSFPAKRSSPVTRQVGARQGG